MPNEALQTFIRQLKESTAYKDHVGVRTVVDETVRRIAALPEEGRGEMLREEIRGLHERVVPLLHGTGVPTGGPKRKEKKGEAISPREAESIIGSDRFFGLDAVRKAFPSIPELRADQLPPITFSKEDLKRAKELGHSLRLRLNKVPGGNDISMKKMQELLQPTFDQKKAGKVLYDTDWYKDEDFFGARPDVCWVLTSDEVIPNSEDKDYLEQTELIAEYLPDTVYQGKKLPQEYADAIKELDAQKDAIRALIDNDDWQEAAKKLAGLKLNQLTRRVPTEVLYDMLVTFQANGKRNLEGMYDWTPVLSSGGGLVYVGGFARGGVRVDFDPPGCSIGGLGVVLSRKF